MATIKFFQEGDTEWIKGKDMIPEEKWSDYDPEALEGERRIQHPGSDEELQLFDIRMTPNSVAEAHAHAESEIIYVVSGEMNLGSHVLTGGCSVQIPGMTLYSFRAGPQGLHFLNFRARQDETYIPKREFMEMRAQSKVSA